MLFSILLITSYHKVGSIKQCDVLSYSSVGGSYLRKVLSCKNQSVHSVDSWREDFYSFEKLPTFLGLCPPFSMLKTAMFHLSDTFSVITSPWSQPERFSSLKNPCNYTRLVQTVPDNLSISGSLTLITDSESHCHMRWCIHRFQILRCGHFGEFWESLLVVFILELLFFLNWGYIIIFKL